MNILLVGQADSIFFEHYIKAIKAKRPDITIDVFSIDSINGKYDLSPCDLVYVNKWETSFLKKIKGLRVIFKPFYTWFSLYLFLKKNHIEYDIIHFKWLIPGVILFPRKTKAFCKKIVATFWGGELESQKILYSSKLYKFLLKQFICNVDAVADNLDEIKEYTNNLRKDTSIYQYAQYGSSIIQEIKNLSINESKNISKIKMGLPENKITIAIGYSGKSLHQHIKIINTLFSNTNFSSKKDNYVFILQMNYGSSDYYINKVETLLKNYNVKYFLLTTKMSEIDIARLRNATDIMIQLSKTDGLSSSIVESIGANNILIVGKWLPYGIFNEKGLYYYKLEKIDDSLPNLIVKITENIDNELKKCQANKNKWKFDTWDEVIDDWINIYDNVLNKC